MRILNVTIFGDNQGTGASHAYDVCWHEIAERAKVIVVKPGGDTPLRRSGRQYEEFSVSTPRPSSSRAVRRMVGRMFGIRGPQILADLDDMVRGLVLVFRLRKVIGASDRVHSDSMWFTVFASFSNSVRKKLVHTELAGDWRFVADGTADFLTYLSYGCFGRKILNRVSVIAQSPAHASTLMSCGVDRRGIEVVWHGRVDSAVFRPTAPKDPSHYTVLFVGRIVPQKGVHVLLQAAEMLSSRLPGSNSRFLIVGPVGEFGLSLSTSEYFEGLRREVVAKGLTSMVEFKRFVSLQELVSLYSAADVYVLPSLQDAFPFSVIEAMMCGTPVVGTDSGGMKEEILDGEVGFVLPPGDPGLLAEKLELLYQDDDRRASMGRAARAYAVERFALQGFSRDLLEAVVSDRRR